MNEKKSIGKLKPEQIRMTNLPKLPDGAIAGFESLDDLTGTISDVCDFLGIVCTIGSMTLPPVTRGKRIVGPALTVRNVARTAQIHKAANDGRNTMGETEAHNIAEPGDVLVIEGMSGCSNMGGQSSTIGRRQGEIGAIVDGTLRDPGHYERSGWPVWCRGFTPVTGKWRLQTVEVNGPVHIAGVQVNAGDLVCADDAGICFIPHAQISEVLELCIKFDQGDARREADIAAGASVADLVQKKYK
jgi:regulator of RNase E activity RraA